MHTPLELSVPPKEEFRAEVVPERPASNRSSALSRAVHSALIDAGPSPLREVCVVDEHDILALEGRVPSYYHKQLAQEITQRVEGVGRIVNRIEVATRRIEGPSS